MLTPGGLLLDLHPVPPDPHVEARGVAFGRLERPTFFNTVAETEARLDDLVREALFAYEKEFAFDAIDRYETVADVLADWGENPSARCLEPRMRSVNEPIDVRQHCVLRTLRRL